MSSRDGELHQTVNLTALAPVGVRIPRHPPILINICMVSFKDFFFILQEKRSTITGWFTSNNTFVEVLGNHGTKNHSDNYQENQRQLSEQ